MVFGKLENREGEPRVPITSTGHRSPSPGCRSHRPFVEPVPKLLQGPLPGEFDHTRWDSGGAGDLGVSPGPSLNSPQQGLLAGDSSSGRFHSVRGAWASMASASAPIAGSATVVATGLAGSGAVLV